MDTPCESRKSCRASVPLHIGWGDALDCDPGANDGVWPITASTPETIHSHILSPLYRP